MLLPLVDRFDCLQQIAGAIDLLGTVDQRAHVFGETRAAIAAARVDEVIANALVGANAQAHGLDVGAQVLGQFGNLVDKADLGCQHAVGGVFGQLGAAQVHENDAVMVAVERGVEVTHDLAHFIAGATNDDTVRATAVGDGGAFLEKFRVGHYVKLQRAPGLFQGLVDMGGEGIAGAHGHGGFLHQDQRLLAVAGNGVTNGEHLAQVSRAIFAWRRAHGDKQYLAVFDGGFFVAGKTQALAFEVFAHQGGEPRLENTDVALLQ